MAFVIKLADLLWTPWLLGLFLLVGGYYTLRTRLFQLHVPTWLRHTLLARPSPQTQPSGGLTQFQALSTALASTIGTGSIAGVATAIFFGGPGAVFWMWISALLGMMTGFGEKTLAVAYRDSDGEGGPMCYMAQGLGRPGKALAVFFSLACVFASLAGGAMVQANSISSSLRAAFGWSPLAVGVVTAAGVGAVIFGGLSRVGRFSERVVPLMAALFVGGSVLVLFVHRAALPAALSAIWRGAFRPQAAFGGYSASLALRYGVARGVFTNEAGLGSSAMAHAAAQVDHPAREGMWGMVEVAVSTLLVCTLTALVILTSGVYDPAAALSYLRTGAAPAPPVGAPLSAAAFSTVFGAFGPAFVSVCLLLFAFTSLLGWSYYGERGAVYLLGSRGIVPFFRAVFLVSIVAGSLCDVSAVWALADLCNALMALPNLTALLLLSPQALALLADYRKAPRRFG